MSWHGAMVRFRTRETPSGDPVEKKLYFDQISARDNKQDKDAVINLFEALVISLKRTLPHVSTITVQNDNASCYQNVLMILLLPITQDRKSMLDAHFARTMKKVHRYVQPGQ
ncbi:hypothetical protein PHMEG_00017405 [Phytophthora megakarya]|uniref:Uncharacterized protein n=1 Tax=Phytophthora megakarya TaxID=4795 RepID=A0A225VWX3_9STRA|nr:hypothetical protein PHMEG_00017405 [Phytophthora megakarya]